MSSWARIGAKCVCVESITLDEMHPQSRSTPNPEVGSVYVIDDIRPGGKYIGIAGLSDSWFRTTMFRPLITKTQSEDIEMFLRIASKAPSNMESTGA